MFAVLIGRLDPCSSYRQLTILEQAERNRTRNCYITAAPRGRVFWTEMA